MFEAGVLFKDMDTDGNSAIDEDEFVAFFGVAPVDDVEAPTITDMGTDAVDDVERSGQALETLIPESNDQQDAGARP